MQKFKQPFDPDLLSVYNRGNHSENNLDSRWLFYQLNKIKNKSEVIPVAYQFVVQGLKQAEQQYSQSFIPQYSVESLTALQPLNIGALSEQLLTEKSFRECIWQFSTVQLTQPCWLQIYLQLTQKGELNNLYHSLLLTQGIKSPVLYNYQYHQKVDISTGFIDFSTTQQALSCFPRVFFAEILGFTLAYMLMPSLIETCFPDEKLPSAFFKQRKIILQKQLAPLLKCICDYLDLYPQHQQILWHRLQTGFWLYQLRMQQCRDQFSIRAEELHSPLLAVSKLFQNKLVSAMGHHHKISLQGIPLEQWFAEMPGNNIDFLKVLKQSHYVDNDNVLNSRLLKLFKFKGPMFGVLDQAEMSILENWLLSEENDHQLKTPQNTSLKLSIASVTNKKVLINYEKLSNRELYYYLVNADLYPDVFSAAKVKVERLLQLNTLFKKLPFKSYSHQKFDDFISNIYQTEIRAYQPLIGEPRISKSAYIWGIEQIAPMILIDGCWLQNCHDIQYTHPEIYQIMFSIYADEIGNGHRQQNHCYIFQQLLKSLSIDVPPVYSKAITQQANFINSAFDLPTYMLSLSLHTQQFLPELLGLNMAIELSGLGREYLQLIDEWNYWGIDITIANIHVSIDNYAEGHTFLAKKAIQLYLDDILNSTGDSKIVDKHWKRIYDGYTSLRFVGTRFKFALPVYYMMNKLKP
mgnify:CR=1 FL=1